MRILPSLLFSAFHIEKVCSMRNNRGLKGMALLTAIGMFCVLLAGALVTKTESGRGCGEDWPLCNGKFIPAYTIESMIEYSHRAVSGIVGILVLVTVIWVWRVVRERKDIRLYAISALFFTVLQAILGAMAVIWEQSNAVMALHFGFSLVAFASTLLLAIAIWRIHLPAHPSGWGLAYTQGLSVTKGFRNLVWVTTVYSYVVVYIGAYVRHTDSGGGCEGWPLCNGQVIPEWLDATIIAFFHRLAALALLLLTLWMVYKALRNYMEIRSIRIAGLITGGLILLQVISGGWVAFTMGNENLYLFTSLLHNVIVSGLFGILCYLSVLVWQLGGHRNA
jgi:cytochrome c oxidase assembly protein subunit 15